jgi:two-component system response regulator DevR
VGRPQPRSHGPGGLRRPAGAVDGDQDPQRSVAACGAFGAPGRFPGEPERLSLDGVPGGGDEDKIRIMLVDDYEVVRTGLRAMIETEEDLEVVAEAGGGEESVLLARSALPDVVVMDVRMPGGGGVEACRALRDEHPGVQVVMLTSFSDAEALFNAIMAGASGFVLKQIRGRDLIDAIRKVAAGQSLLDPRVTERVLDRLRHAKGGDGDPKLSRLSAQEERILDLVADGRTNREIAEAIHLSDKTVKNYVSAILQKLQVQRRSEAASYLARVRASRPPAGSGQDP